MTENTATAISTLDQLVDVFRDILDFAGLTEDTDFYEAGGDSLTAFQITGRLEEILGVDDIPVSLVFAYPTPRDLAEVVDADYGRA
ncbi:acyl carrier protein [Streptomyces sp. SCSIO ZS0520]|uniref:acyl carrier protein n=1 Tax=Streptomyces sp. SCSIO ZS0520 TaxID=2892996 RepID=UPI0021DAC61B|nr:acyl carrier protein [Streptomyces sp. SCSIO ZS0520]